MNKKINIAMATQTRGFWKHLSKNKNLMFQLKLKQSYEISNKNKLKMKIAKSNLFDFLGIIQRISYLKEDCDLVGSFNRFLNTNKDYFIYLENPTALYHYRLNRGKSFFGKKKIDKYMNDAHLKTIICMSKACETTFEKVCHKVDKNKISIETIYPLVKTNNSVNIEQIKSKNENQILKLLYIAQGSRFISKGILNVLEVMNKFQKQGLRDIHLTIITQIDMIPSEQKKKILQNKNIELLNFGFTYDELEKIYMSHHVLVHPSSDDSSPSTVLEAIKSGLPIISTRLYAIPEMVKENVNGYLCDPQWWFFDKNNIPNPKVWNHRKKTIHSFTIDQNMVDFLYDKIILLYNDRSKLNELAINSFKMANSYPFDEKTIVNQWNNIISNMIPKGEKE